mgnify:CR=1 FL=1
MSEEAQEAPAAAPASGGGDATKRMAVLLVVLSILVIVLTPTVCILAFKAMRPQDVEIPEGQDTPMEINKLGDISVNIRGTQGTRYVQVSIALTVSDPEMQSFFEEYDRTNNPEGMLNRMRARVNSIVSDKTLSELESLEARQKLQDEIQKALNDLLHERTEGIVQDVYFPKFLIQ